MLLKLDIFIVAAAIALLSACGGGGGPDVASGGAVGGGGGTPPTTYSGVFFDAPTQGLTYKASPSNLTGVTDSAGTFEFLAGDTVTFSIPTGDPLAPLVIGSATPPTPPTSSVTAYVPVLSLANGTQVAQILQTLGGTGTVINVTGTGTSLTSSQVSVVRSFINSSGVTTPPLTLNGNALVSAQIATANSLASISTLSNQQLPDTIDNFIKGKVIFGTGVATRKDMRNSALTDSVYQVGGFYYPTDNPFQANGINYKGNWAEICAELEPITASISVGNYCISDAGVGPNLTRLRWEAISNNSFGITRADNPLIDGNGNNVKIPFIDNQNGAASVELIKLNNSTRFTNPRSVLPLEVVTQYAGWTTLQSAFSTATIANSTIRISGEKLCTDGLAIIQFTNNGNGYSFSCSSSRVSGSNTPIQGTIQQVASMPGILKLTETIDFTKITYVGLVVGGTMQNGILAVVKQGKSVADRFAPSGFSSTCSHQNPSDCGFSGLQKFTN